MDEKLSKAETEIELTEIFRVIWKWKYFIITLTFVFVITAVIISVNAKKVYRLSTTMELGILNINHRGEKILVESPLAIKDMIKKGAFRSEIARFMKNSSGGFQMLSGIDVRTYKNSNIMELILDTADTAAGKEILVHMSKILKIYLSKVAASQFNEEDIQNQLMAEELIEKENQISLSQKAIITLQNRIEELNEQLKETSVNYLKIIEEQNISMREAQARDKLLLKAVYNSMLHQNVSIASMIKNEINYYDYRLRTEKSYLQNFQFRAQKLKEKTMIFSMKRDKLKVLEIISPPRVSKNYVKPRIKQNTIVSLFAGIFFSIIAAFFLEYFRKYNLKKNYLE
jgi:capsular polysaccharide biosynthesis protein